MVGKWHLGHAQRKMTPAFRGFDQFTGIYMWDADSFSKQIYDKPWQEPMMIDWVSEYSNGTYSHYAEPRHSTLAITNKVTNIILHHDINRPLYIYIPYTAAHSPLQPMPEHLAQCSNIAQTYRKLYCGMVVGIDESIKNITYYAYHYLGPNTIFIVSSDNGGSPWFGGLNYPLRGSKNTPYEGGIKVPGFITELPNLSIKSIHSSSFVTSNLPLADVFDSKISNRTYNHLFHISDWFPTIASLIGIPDANISTLDLDGIDLVNGLPLIVEYKKSKSIENIRSEVLLEFYLANESAFQQDLFTYRINEMKYIEGVIRDGNYYYPSSDHRINNTARLLLEQTTSLLSDKHILTKILYYYITYIGESIIDFITYLYDEGSFDTLRIIITHTIIQKLYTNLTPFDVILNSSSKQLIHNKYNYTLDEDSSKYVLHDVYLYNLTSDPFEENNLVDEFPDLLEIFRNKINHYKNHRPLQQKVWYQLPLLGEWELTHIPGDCTVNKNIKPENCKFTHPWIPDDIDPFTYKSDALVDALINAHLKIKKIIQKLFIIIITFIFVILSSIYVLYRYRTNKK